MEGMLFIKQLQMKRCCCLAVNLRRRIRLVVQHRGGGECTCVVCARLSRVANVAVRVYDEFHQRGVDFHKFNPSYERSERS